MPLYSRTIQQDYSRDPAFADMYRAETRRLHTPPETRPVPAQNQDRAILLPILLLLLTEGADRYLILALLYILL